MINLNIIMLHARRDVCWVGTQVILYIEKMDFMVNIEGLVNKHYATRYVLVLQFSVF